MFSPLIRRCAYQGVRNNSFLENFAYVQMNDPNPCVSQECLFIPESLSDFHSIKLKQIFEMQKIYIDFKDGFATCFDLVVKKSAEKESRERTYKENASDFFLVLM